MSEGILNPIQQLQADFDFDVYTKQEVDTLLDGKADKVDTYTKTETDALLNEKADVATTYTKTETNDLLNGKADKSTTLAGYGITDAYTKAQTDNLLNGKADTNSVYTKEETDNLLSAKANSADVYTKTETNNLLSVKADSANVYTKTESNTLLAGKADTDDVYTKTEIDNQLTVTKDGTWVKGTQTTATNLEKLEGGIEYLYGLLSYKYSQLRKYINGNYYDYETNTDTAYTKTVPAGAMPYAGLEQIGGKTVAWNQLVNTGTTNVSTIDGRKYYTLIDGIASIVTSDGTDIAIVDDIADMVIDLTLMFGSGNEPTTVEEFESMFPASYYPYNAGQLLSAGVTEIVSQGKNLLPNTFPSNKINATINNGVITTATNARTFAIPCQPNTNYYASQKATGIGWTIAFSNKLPAVGDTVDTKGNMLKRTVFPISSGNNQFLIISVPYEVVLTTDMPNNEAMIEIGTTKTDYSPYHAPISYPIPTAIQQLEGYGWSAGSVYNYIDYERKKFVKRVGAVDLGTLSWSYYSSGYFRTNVFSSAKAGVNNVVANVVCIPYIATAPNSIANKTVNIATNGRVVIEDDSYSGDASAFATAMSGVYLYYELATPIETDISAYITDDNLIEVEAGGTLTFPNSNGTDYQIPVPSEETYMINLQEAVSNG